MVTVVANCGARAGAVRTSFDAPVALSNTRHLVGEAALALEAAAAAARYRLNGGEYMCRVTRRLVGDALPIT